MKSVERQTGKTPPELILPEVDKSVDYLWGKYLSIQKGCDMVDLQAIHAYLSITRTSLTQFELDTLLDIERVRYEVNHG